MLGSVKSEQRWQWGAYGKHPVSRDFFRIGRDFPLMKNFSEWVEKGYTMLASKSKGIGKSCSWRFWAKGLRKEFLVCGLVRDSSDRLGRPYPLLVMGTGILKRWEDQWDLLPFACEKTWDQVEYLSAQRYNDFTKLEVDVSNIRSPYSEWQEFKTKRESSLEFVEKLEDTSFQDLRDLEDLASKMSKKTECFVCLDNKLFQNQTVLINYWHVLFKTHPHAVPSAIFMGGTIERAYLVLFRRPLTPVDFAHLWSVTFPESMGSDSLFSR
ncbi:MAG: type VI secretion system-associated protein TagF [Planctomycetia bacterium]|nr:type VI secretion system-associated protein TagF [Planctomycetia bacterium]